MTLGVVGPYDAVDPARHLTDIPVVFTMVSTPVEVEGGPEPSPPPTET